MPDPITISLRDLMTHCRALTKIAEDSLASSEKISSLDFASVRTHAKSILDMVPAPVAAKPATPKTVAMDVRKTQKAAPKPAAKAPTIDPRDLFPGLRNMRIAP